MLQTCRWRHARDAMKIDDNELPAWLQRAFDIGKDRLGILKVMRIWIR